ncbi:MAG: MFS transporter [Thermosipho sp. (in: Bacteria)]|nr:MFS transporter [Thermosipho sp. (in: thermotogales)]
MEKLFVMLNVLAISTIVNSLAPLMPVFQKELNISISSSSFLPVLSVLGTTVFSFLISILISRLGLKRTNISGYILMFLGLLLFSFSRNSFEMAVGAFLIGSSTAILFTSLTTLLAHLKNPRFGLTHAFFGIGGILAPLLVSFSIKNDFSYRYLYLLYFFVMILFFIWNFVLRLPNAKYESFNFSKMKKTILKPLFFISIISFFLYSGSEISLITWASNLFIYFGFNEAKAAIIISLFWIFYTLSRFLSDFIVKIFGEKKMVIFSALLSPILISLMLLTKNAYLFSVIGFFMGTIFPMIQRYANMNLDKEEVGLLNGVTYGSTGIGGMFFSSVMGYIANFSIPGMFVLPLLGLFALSAVQIFEKKGERT